MYQDREQDLRPATATGSRLYVDVIISLEASQAREATAGRVKSQNKEIYISNMNPPSPSTINLHLHDIPFQSQGASGPSHFISNDLATANGSC